MIVTIFLNFYLLYHISFTWISLEFDESEYYQGAQNGTDHGNEVGGLDDDEDEDNEVEEEEEEDDEDGSDVVAPVPPPPVVSLFCLVWIHVCQSIIWNNPSIFLF